MERSDSDVAWTLAAASCASTDEGYADPRRLALRGGLRAHARCVGARALDTVGRAIAARLRHVDVATVAGIVGGDPRARTQPARAIRDE
jgi:hypothetical protein